MYRSGSKPILAHQGSQDRQQALYQGDAIFLAPRGQPAAAEPYLKEALDVQLENLGADNPRLAGPMHNLGMVMQSRGDYAGARAQYEQLLGILKRGNASNTWANAQVISSLGWLDFDQTALRGGPARGRGGCGTAPEAGWRQYAGIRDVAATDVANPAVSARPRVATTEVRLGEALLAERTVDQAEPLLRHALDALEHPAFRVPAWQVAEAKAAYGVCLQDLGRKSEGDALVAASRADLQSEGGVRRGSGCH